MNSNFALTVKAISNGPFVDVRLTNGEPISSSIISVNITYFPGIVYTTSSYKHSVANKITVFIHDNPTTKSTFPEGKVRLIDSYKFVKTI